MPGCSLTVITPALPVDGPLPVNTKESDFADRPSIQTNLAGSVASILAKKRLRGQIRTGLALCVLGLIPQAHGEKKAPAPSWNVVPGVIRPGTDGKYPPTATLVFFSTSCDRDANGKWTLASETFTLTIAGSGITLSNPPSVGDCYLTTTATIPAGVQSDKYPIIVTSKDAAHANTVTDRGYGDLNVLGPLAGPTPSTPEVDVEWSVLSQHTCSDTFGNHVGNSFYCVQVTIGNNSAYKLQISSIAFKTPSLFSTADAAFNINPNTSYRTTRAVAQAGQNTTARNLIFNSLGATGLIMGAFTPFFHNTYNVSRWSTGAAIVSGTFTSAMNIVAPDQTIRELNNLDDESLRDGKIIPNNTQNSPFDIFVERQQVLPYLSKLLSTYQTTWKDTTDAGQKDILARLNRCVVKHGNYKDCDPDIIKEAMGALVLEGHKIDYVERIVVDSSVTSQEVTAPSVSNADQVSVTADHTKQTIQLQGTNLKSVTNATTQDAGVQVDPKTVNSDGSLSVPVTILPAFQGNSFSLLLASPSGNITVKIPVKPAVAPAPDKNPQQPAVPNGGTPPKTDN